MWNNSPVRHILRDRRALILTAGAVLAGLSAPLLPQSSPAIAQSSAAAALPATLDARSAHAKAVAHELVLVDIRSPGEWRRTGIPASAYAISLDQPPKAFMAALTNVVAGDKTKPLALICATGGRSSDVAGQLRRLGFTNVLDVGDGVAGSRKGPGWINAGLPMRPGTEAAAPPSLGPPASTGGTPRGANP